VWRTAAEPGRATRTLPGEGTVPSLNRRDGPCHTGRMPVLDPHPAGGQKKLLLILGAMLGITVVIAVIATLAAP
jgi:hypothetical protein